MVPGFRFFIPIILLILVNGSVQAQDMEPTAAPPPGRLRLELSQEALDKAGIDGIRFDADLEVFFQPLTAMAETDAIISGSLDSSFARITKKGLSYREDGAWIKFQVENTGTTPVEAVLSMDYLILDHVELFEKGRSQPLGITGDMVSRYEKTFDSMVPSFAVALEPHAQKTFYLRMQTTSAYELKMRFRSLRQFKNFETGTIWILGCLAGGFLIMFFYNVGVAVAIRSLVYTVYSILIMVSLIRELSLLGMLPYFILPNNTHLASVIGRFGLSFSISIVCIFLMLFLELGKKKGWGYWALLILMTCALASSVATLGTGGGSPTMSKILLLEIMSISLLAVIISWHQYFKGFKEARFFAMAWTVASMGFGSNVLVASGLINAGTYGLTYGMFGQFVELILLSFAFGDKVNRIRADKTKATLQLQEQLQHFNERLQTQVKEKTRDIKSILDNIHQGIMPIRQAGTSADAKGAFQIAEDHSAFLSQILGTSELAHQDPFVVLFQKTNLSVDTISQVESALYSMLGEPALQYELNGHLLPTQAIMRVGAETKFLSMDWDAVIDEGTGTIVRILLVLKDVTEVRKLEEARQKYDREIAVIGQIVKIDEVKYLEFLRLAETYLSETLSILREAQARLSETSEEQAKDSKDRIYRVLHTVKGLARTYMMTEISDAVHEAESICHHWATAATSLTARFDLLEQRLGQTMIVLDEYKRLNFQVLGRRAEAVVRMDRSYIESAISTISQQLMTENVDKIQIARVVYDFKKLYMKTIDSLLTEDIKGLSNIAQKMGKTAPRFVFKIDSSLFLRREIEGPLHEAFTHTLRNSIDHGIEHPDERAIKGKPAQGSIFISTEITDDQSQLVIEISDDGAGLKLSRIGEKARETGMVSPSDLQRMSDQDIADLIFEPGLSMARNLTDISGRGIGMDTIRKALQEIGGDAQILLKGRLSDGSVPFVTRLTIPTRYFDFWRVESLPQVA